MGKFWIVVALDIAAVFALAALGVLAFLIEMKSVLGTPYRFKQLTK